MNPIPSSHSSPDKPPLPSGEGSSKLVAIFQNFARGLDMAFAPSCREWCLREAKTPLKREECMAACHFMKAVNSSI